MRRRILALVIGMTVLVVLAFAIPLIFLIRNVVAQQADDRTRTVARDVSLTLFGSSTTLTDTQLKALAEKYQPRRVTIVKTDFFDGGFGGGTPAGPGGGAPPDAQLQHVSGGYETVTFARRPSSSAAGGGGGYRITVFESDAVRYDGQTPWLWLLAGGSIGLLLIGAAAGEVLTRRIARPLVRTAETAQQLSLGDTTARAPTDGPREVSEVGVALNRLADRIDELIAEERETVADLSHRLRTPLTTLRLDAEALRDPVEAERVGTHVTALERMLTAIIHAARRPQREGRLPSCDATLVVAERVTFWSALTDEQGRPSTVSLPREPVPVRASAEDLGAAVDALLENVVAHTPEETSFSVRLAAVEGGARLEVGDAGPGIPAEADVRGRSDRGSTGLGLDIVRRCAEATGGTMTISRAPTGGALVTLDLRAP